MAFYESIFIIRPDVSSSDVDKIVDNFGKIIKETSGKLVKTEYWGLRSLSYEIQGNKKAHYVFLGIESEIATIQEIERKAKLSEDVLRFVPIRVPAIGKEPSPILKTDKSENEELINVTADHAK